MISSAVKNTDLEGPTISANIRRTALLALALGGFAIGLTEFVIMGILPEVATALGIDIPTAGHFISAYALGVVVGGPIFTALGSRYPSHRVLVALMVWFTVFNSLSALTFSYHSLLLSRFLAGLPHGAFFGIGAVVAGRIAEKGKAAQAAATFWIGAVAFAMATPIQFTMIHASHGAEMMGSAINQSAFNLGNAIGAYLGGLPIAFGYGIASADVVGAVMAMVGVAIAGAMLAYQR